MSLALAVLPALAGCDGEAPGIKGHIETLDERMKRQEAAFNALPDIKGDDLRRRLHALGINDAWMKPGVEENGVEILELRVPEAEFTKLDLRALAKLVLDSRYGFKFVDENQARTAALHHGAEIHEREKAKALKELSERGQLETFPRYREGMLMTAFAPQLEAWCGFKHGEALKVIDGAWLDYEHKMVDLAVADQDGRASAAFDCMKRVVDATTELRRRFVGNRGREGAIDY